MCTYRSCVLTCTSRINKVIAAQKDIDNDIREVGDGKTEAE
jgi:hypothetical protein